MDDTNKSTLKELRKILGRAGEMIDDLWYQMETQKDAKDAKNQLSPRNQKTAAHKLRRQRRFKLSPGEIGPEALSLAMTRLANGSAMVQIDRGSKFRLPKALTELLLILADGTTPSDDALVAWKSLDEISRRLSVKRPERVRRKTVINNIYRLKIKLEEHDPGDWRYIQTDAEAGVRFALRRGAASSMLGDPAP